MSEVTTRVRSKIKGLEDLASILRDEKTLGRKVVQCHGVFDLLHIGHIRHFEQARQFGDILVVTLTPDEYVNKGPNRPAFKQQLRAEAIAALNSVDYVAVNEWPLAEETIKLLAPDFYVKGQDYKDSNQDLTGGILLEEAAVKSVGGEIVFTDDIVFSSTSLINEHMPVVTKDLNDYLTSFSSRYSSNDIANYLDGASKLKVLLVGETIIDEYIYCETMGKSGKEPVLVTRQLNTERFAGGVIAVANHVAAFCDDPDLLTLLGQDQEQEQFIREKIDSKVNNIFLYQEENSQTITKRRFVERYPFQKLFEVYLMDDDEHKPVQSAALCQRLEDILPNYDAVIVTDYGHGMLGPEEVEVLCAKAPFLAVNTQVNAGNLGFNTVSKYHRSDFLCVSENELRLESRSRRRELKDIMLDVAESLQCKNMIITRGEKGCICYSQKEGFSEIPAFGTKVVDRVGAGDAVFSVAALCVAQGAPMEVVGFIGNAVGADAVATVGHRNSTEKVQLLRHMDSLLK